MELYFLLWGIMAILTDIVIHRIYSTKYQIDKQRWNNGKCIFCKNGNYKILYTNKNKRTYKCDNCGGLIQITTNADKSKTK